MTRMNVPCTYEHLASVPGGLGASRQPVETLTTGQLSPLIVICARRVRVITLSTDWRRV